MDNRTAAEVIKSNWPSERYPVLRQALSKAIRALEREDRREERMNGKAGKSSGETGGRDVPDVSANDSEK